MYVEIMALSAAGLYFLRRDEMKIKRKWSKIIASESRFTNDLGKTLKILEIDQTEYGWDIKIEFPYGYTYDHFEKDLPVFQEGLGFNSIETENWNNICLLRCVNKIEYSEFKPYPLPPNKLLIAEGLNEPIIVDMNTHPHMLIGGDTGTGKSRLLFCILTNLIATTNQAKIYLLQVRKNDLEVFSSCSQVVSSSKSLEDIRDTLKEIDQECQRREPLINPTKGYYSIEDWNKAKPKLKYIYVVIEEFSLLQRSGGDTKEEDRIKKECLKYLKTVVNVGRSSGVFLITALQKPTADSIPSDIKGQLTTRASMRIKDAAAALVILGNAHGTKLQKRQVIISTTGEQTAYSYTIDHDIIMANIKSSIVDKKPVQKRPKKLNTLGKIGAMLDEAD